VSASWVRVALAAAGVLAVPLLITQTVAGETVQHDNLLVSAHGGVVPHTLPRHGLAPVRVKVAGEIQTTDGQPPPRLIAFSIDVNSHGRVFDRGLPRCRVGELRDATTRQALKVCGDALVGRGQLETHIFLPDQAPFPAQGTLLAFNARIHGHRAVIGQVYGIRPVATTAVVPFVVTRAPGHTFGPRLTAELPSVASNWGFVAGFSMTFGRSYTYRGQRQSYMSAGCPAPRGFPGAPFDLVRLSYQFEGEPPLETTIERECRARR
jgi:hypothetical protein